MRRAPGLILAALVALAAAPSSAAAYDPEQTFRRGAVLLSIEGGWGKQNDWEPEPHSNLEFWNAGVRLSVLPFGTTGSGMLNNVLYGAFEVGLEPFFQRYPEHDAQWAGLAAVFRYHFLGLGRFVPWVELLGAAGGTNLNIPEIRSDFAFLVDGGVGASVLLTDGMAIYAGYRLQHVSNAGTSELNRGFEAHVGVAGVTFFLR